MANFIANATGNLSGSGGNPWATVEAGAGAVQTSIAASTNTTTSEVLCTAFTVTTGDVIDGVLMYCQNLTGVGTVTISLALAGVDQVTVVVNASDLPTNPAWVFFKFTGTYTGTGVATDSIGVKGSSAGNAKFFSSATTNWAYLLRMTTTGTPGTTDPLYAAKELTGAGTSNARTIYADQTCTAKGKISAVTNNGTLVRVTSTAHGRSTNDVLSFQNVLGKIAGNVPYGNMASISGKFTVTVIDANTMDLQGSTFAAGYVSGGVWYLIPTTYGPLTIGFGATLQHGISTGPANSTDYYLGLNGNLSFYDSSTWNMGTSGTRCPSTSSMHLEFQNTSNVQFGVESNNNTNCTLNFYGNNFGTTSAAYQGLTADIGGLVDIGAAGVVTRDEGVNGTFVGLTGNCIINGVTLTISSVGGANTLTLTTSPSTSASKSFAGPCIGTTITVPSTAGWAAGDTVALSNADALNTTVLPGEVETCTILSITDGTHAVVTVAPSFYHAGGTSSLNSVGITSICIHLTRNVQIRGLSTAFNAYCNFGPHAINMSYAEFFQLGSNTTNKKGIDFATGTALGYTTLNVGMTYCSFHDFTVSGAQSFTFQPTTNPVVGGMSVTNNSWYNIAYQAMSIYPFNFAGTFTGNAVLIAAVTGGSNSGGFFWGDAGSTYSNNWACTVLGAGIYFCEFQQVSSNVPNPPIGTFSNNVGQGCVDGFSFPSGPNLFGLSGFGILQTCNAWRNSAHGVLLNDTSADVTFDSWTIHNNRGANVKVNLKNTFGNITWSNCYLDAGPFASGDHASGGNNQNANCNINANGGMQDWRFLTTQFSPANSCGKADFYIYNQISSQYISAKCLNCTFGSTALLANEGGGTSNFFQQCLFGSRLSMEKFNQVAGQHFTLMPEGTIAIDNTFYDPSASDVLAERVQPIATTYLMQSRVKRVAVANGQTVTVSCLVRQSVASDAVRNFSAGTGSVFNSGAYAGNAPRLVCRHNLAIGIGAGTPPADVVLATMTAVTGAITGATNANPIVIASTAHGLSSGNMVGISGVGGNTAANGNWTVTVVDADHFSIHVAGNGAYTSGGNWSKWVTLTNTTSAVTDDGVLEFYVDCGNTNGSTPAGFITVDSWVASGNAATDGNGSQKYWFEGQSYDCVQKSSGGTSPLTTGRIIQNIGTY